MSPNSISVLITSKFSFSSLNIHSSHSCLVFFFNFFLFTSLLLSLFLFRHRAILHLSMLTRPAADIERCHIGDTECIRDVSNKVLEIHGKLGHSGINLLKIDPLHIPNIGIKQGAESPVNIELKFKDVDLIGLSDHKFIKLT